VRPDKLSSELRRTRKADKMRDDPINSTWLYEKLRPFVKLNDQVNMTTLNATNYYRRLEQ